MVASNFVRSLGACFSMWELRFCEGGLSTFVSYSDRICIKHGKDSAARAPVVLFWTSTAPQCRFAESDAWPADLKA
jgi:hypothetical protein